MPEMNRRSVLTLGAALGLASVIAPKAAWSWSPAGSVLGTGAGIDPQWVWDDDLDRIMASALTNGQVASINQAIAPWVNNKTRMVHAAGPTRTPSPHRC